jgi:hypothetical protein
LLLDVVRGGKPFSLATTVAAFPSNGTGARTEPGRGHRPALLRAISVPDSAGPYPVVYFWGAHWTSEE